MHSAGYLATTSFVALALALTASQHAAAAVVADATASSADDAASVGLEEVIVTAQKRSENLQDTPIAISVLSATAVENRHVVSLVDLGDGAIPSLKVAPFFSRPGALIINVRGIGVLSDSNQPARDQGVGVYVDGVDLGRPPGLGTALYDIESIEVLKGPQGTLFGRNTEGGAVNVVTKRPSGEYRLRAVGGIGNYGSYKSELHMDLPRFAGVSIKLDGVIAARDGILKNPLVQADDFGAYDKRGVHVEALWEPSPNFSADYAYDNSRDETTTLYQQLTEPGALRLAATATLQVGRAKAANVGVPQQPSIGTTEGHRLTLDWHVNDKMLVKSITSYRELNQSQYDNGSAAFTMINQTGNFTGFNFGRYSLAFFDQDQFGQEIQVIGDLPRVQYVFGALYYRENVEDSAQAFATNQFTDAAGSAFTLLSLDYTKQRIDRASRVRTTSEGVFGHQRRPAVRERRLRRARPRHLVEPVRSAG